MEKISTAPAQGDTQKSQKSKMPRILERRPNRPAASRRQQYHRAHARNIQAMLKALDCLDHRGCRRSQLGESLHRALHGGDGCARTATHRAAVGVQVAEGTSLSSVEVQTGLPSDSIRDKLSFLTDELGAMRKLMDQAMELLAAVNKEAAAEAAATESAAVININSELLKVQQQHREAIELLEVHKTARAELDVLIIQGEQEQERLHHEVVAQYIKGRRPPSLEACICISYEEEDSAEVEAEDVNEDAKEDQEVAPVRARATGRGKVACLVKTFEGHRI